MMNTWCGKKRIESDVSANSLIIKQSTAYDCIYSVVTPGARYMRHPATSRPDMTYPDMTCHTPDGKKQFMFVIEMRGLCLCA